MPGASRRDRGSPPRWGPWPSGAPPGRPATWNVNSLRQRLDHLARFAAEAEPDMIRLQETEVTDARFPRGGAACSYRPAFEGRIPEIQGWFRDLQFSSFVPRKPMPN